MSQHKDCVVYAHSPQIVGLHINYGAQNTRNLIRCRFYYITLYYMQQYHIICLIFLANYTLLANGISHFSWPMRRNEIYVESKSVYKEIQNP